MPSSAGAERNKPRMSRITAPSIRSTVSSLRAAAHAGCNVGPGPTGLIGTPHALDGVERIRSSAAATPIAGLRAHARLLHAVSVAAGVDSPHRGLHSQPELRLGAFL